MEENLEIQTCKKSKKESKQKYEQWAVRERKEMDLGYLKLKKKSLRRKRWLIMQETSWKKNSKKKSLNSTMCGPAKAAISGERQTQKQATSGEGAHECVQEGATSTAAFLPFAKSDSEWQG